MTEKIKAPVGNVLKGYMLDINPFSCGLVRHVLIDEWGLVFVPSWGWGSYQNSYRIFALPVTVERGNCVMGWVWAGWWERNW